MAKNTPNAVELQTNHKDPRLSLQIANIEKDTKTIRSLDWDRSRFDIEFGLRNGTTYNSFLIESDKTALIDTSHLKFKQNWIKELKNIIDINSIDYLIVSHTEPDHSGLIGFLLDINSNIEIVSSKVGIKFLESQLHREFKSKAVKSGDIIDLGKSLSTGINHQIEFLSAPNLHWPDTIFSYDHGTEVLFTCDAFGLHYCSENLFDINPSSIAPDFQFYYDCLMRPNSRSVVQALKRIDQLPTIKTIAVGHGPLLRDHLLEWVSKYRKWSSASSKAESYIAVCYMSQYGFCDRLSQAIAHGITKTNTQVQLVDLIGSDAQELSALISEASAVIVPTWPINPDSDLQSSIGTLIAGLKKKQWVGVYDSFGGNDEPIDVVFNQINSLGQKSAFDPLRVKTNPDSNTYQIFEEAGTDIGQIISRKKNIAAVKSLDGDLIKALGRISGGLYVVTASQEDNGIIRRSAMIASWVSQASFNPPGLTVAVAKDRAIEALMQVGDNFVLNILEENNYINLFRHFLKRFPPGADRFEGIAYLDNIAKGGPVLTDTLAFISCSVKQRLETPDHWIVYAIVEDGKVANHEARTAVHHRKVGSTY